MFNARITRFAALCLLLAATPAWTQEGEAPEPVPLPPPPFGQGDSEAGDLQKEMKELFLKVEANLKRIDNQLADAGAGEIKLEEVEDAGLDDILRAVQARGEETKSQIDRILEIAKQLDQSGAGGGGGGGAKKPGQEPQPGGKSQGEQQQENTPEAKQKEQDSETAPGQEKGQEDPKPGPEGDPTDGGDSEERGGQNLSGDLPKDGAQARLQHSLEADKWGFLPERQRRTFRNQGRDNLPVQYRQWIDTYYRRLNKGNR